MVRFTRTLIKNGCDIIESDKFTVSGKTAQGVPFRVMRGREFYYLFVDGRTVMLRDHTLAGIANYLKVR